MLREMKYLEAVALEVLRFRPPAPMVPHLTSEEFRLTNDYVIPKGTVVFPSVTDFCLQRLPEPENSILTGLWRRGRRTGVTRGTFLYLELGLMRV